MCIVCLSTFWLIGEHLLPKERGWIPQTILISSISRHGMKRALNIVEICCCWDDRRWAMTSSWREKGFYFLHRWASINPLLWSRGLKLWGKVQRHRLGACNNLTSTLMLCETGMKSQSVVQRQLQRLSLLPILRFSALAEEQRPDPDPFRSCCCRRGEQTFQIAGAAAGGSEGLLKK